MGVGVISSWEIREDGTESRSNGKSVDGWSSGEDNRKGCKEERLWLEARKRLRTGKGSGATIYGNTHHLGIKRRCSVSVRWSCGTVTPQKHGQPQPALREHGKESG